MCIICLQFEQGKMNAQEVRQALGEMVVPEEHKKEIEELIEEEKDVT